MKTLIKLLIVLLFVGCASETEQKGLDQIADLYDAKTSYSKGFSSAVGTETIRQFDVKVSESKLIDSLPPTVTTANIAMLVYESLTEDEKSKYDQIYVQLVNLKLDTASYTYPTQVLDNLSEKAKVYKRFSESLVSGDYEIVDEIKDHKLMPTALSDGLKANMLAREKALGSLIAYEPFGIAEMTIEDEKIYQYQGFFVFRNGAKVPYTVMVNIADGKNDMEGFRIFK